MEPAHVAAFVMDCHIVIQCRIHASGTQTIGNCQQKQHPEISRQEKAHHGKSRHAGAECRNPAGTEAVDHPVSHQTGHHRAGRNGHGNHAHIRNRHPKKRVHTGPRRSQQGIGQSQRDKGKIDHRKQKTKHELHLRTARVYHPRRQKSRCIFYRILCIFIHFQMIEIGVYLNIFLSNKDNW